ncbi:MAG: DNA repair exonuclease [Acidobacteriota bacterium]
MKLLAVGDLHLGRRPSRLPESLADRSAELGPAGAWERIVEAAVRERIDLLALAGDVVEHEGDFFEAYRVLRRGLERLAAERITLVAVAGNHDVRVLPRLARELPQLNLLGSQGEWEARTFQAAGEAVTLWGRSFVSRLARENPLPGFRPALGPGLNLGLLHCDRDQTASDYVPVRTQDLEQAGLDGWLLGHVHRPDSLAAPRPLGYLGSVTALDPGEPGDRGPWLLEIAGGRCVRIEQWVLAPLRWELLELDLTGLERPDEAEHLLLERLRRLEDRLQATHARPEAVGLRVNLCGRTRWGRKVKNLLEGGDLREGLMLSGGSLFFLDRVTVLTHPELALDELARRTDPPGLLARRLLLLEGRGDEEQRRALLDRFRRRLRKRVGERKWSAFSDIPASDEELAESLREAGSLLLDRLLAQKESEDAPGET